MRPEQPTPAEVEKAAKYWAYVGAVTCQHESFTFDTDATLTCGGRCGLRLHVLSDLQIEDLLEKARDDAQG